MGVKTVHRYPSMAVALILGLVFLASGVAKLLDVRTFVDTVAAYGVPRKLAYGAVFIPPLEILLGLGLCLLLYTRRLTLVALGTLLLFTLGFAYANLAQGVDDCGCFGTLPFLRTSPLVSFIRNILMMAAAVYLWWRPVASTRNNYRAWQWVLISMVGAVAFVAAGMSAMRPFYVSGSPSEHPFLHRQISDTPLASLIETSPDSTYLVFVYSPTCPHCWDAVENVKAYQRTNVADRVIGLTVGTDSTVVAFKTRFKLNFETYLTDVEHLGQLTDRLPTTFFIQRDTVAYISKRTIPSPFTFQAMLRAAKGGAK